MPKLRLKNILSRTSSGLVLGLIILLLVLFHKGFTLIIALLFATVAFFEVMFVNKNQKSIWYSSITLILFIWVISSGINNFVLLRSFPKGAWASFKVFEVYKIMLLFFWLIISPLFNERISYRTISTHTVALSLLVVSARAFIWILLKSDSYGQGFELLALVLVLVICCDIGGYFIGSILGKRKISPNISPKKTWEGFLGGVILAHIWVVIWQMNFYVPFIDPARDAGYQIWFITWVLSLSSLVGDLYFSLLKRSYNLDDFSNTIPGHGGVLDRLDSIVFSVIAFYFILTYAI